MDWCVDSHPTNCSITLWIDGTHIGTASANRYRPIPGAWWISRVLVSAASRGKGWGGKILEHLCNEARGQGAKSMVVTPGGYGQDEAQQRRFYEAHEFVKVGEGFDMYWSRTFPPWPEGTEC